MSTYLDLGSMNSALKELYDDQKVENLIYAKNPFLALVPKKEDFGGKSFPQPVVWGTSQGRSSTFSNALSNQTAASIAEFQITRKADYSLATVDNQTRLAARGDKDAFLSAIEVAVDNALRASSVSLASALFRAGTGTVGAITTISTGVITLTNSMDVVQFEVGQTLQANATDGGTPRAALGFVISVDRVGGTVTVSATGQGGAAGSPAAWAPADFLLVQGDVNAKVSGLQAWLPTSAPSGADNFYGVNRSSDTRLSGWRSNQAAASIEEGLIGAAMDLGREGGDPTHAFINFTSYKALIQALGSKVQYVDEKGPGEIGFRALEVFGPYGTLKVIPDRSCPAFTAYLLDLKTWEFRSIGKAPGIIDYEGTGPWQRVYNADAVELRCGYYGNLSCRAPGWNAVVTLQQ